uniref:F-box/WD repeat-containing protein 5 n=1 Tax=Magallana gigas TaxID=29159 RepID=K1Q278_MAGGI
MTVQDYYKIWYLVYSCRYLTEDDDWCFERDILTVVYDLILDQCQENVYLGGHASSTDHLRYIFPDLSQDFVATGDEVTECHLWDRHYGVKLEANILHRNCAQQSSGLNAVAFHPYDQETLVTAGDDRLLKQWYKVANDEVLWQNLVHQKIQKHAPLPADKHSWREEYKRLAYHIPSCLAQDVAGHENRIVFLTFSPSGKYLASVGEDGTCRVWNYGRTITLQYTVGPFSNPPLQTSFCEFNESETLLLIAGLNDFDFEQMFVTVFSVPVDEDSSDEDDLSDEDELTESDIESAMREPMLYYKMVRSTWFKKNRWQQTRKHVPPMKDESSRPYPQVLRQSQGGKIVTMVRDSDCGEKFEIAFFSVKDDEEVCATPFKVLKVDAKIIGLRVSHDQR